MITDFKCCIGQEVAREVMELTDLDLLFSICVVLHLTPIRMAIIKKATFINVDFCI